MAPPDFIDVEIESLNPSGDGVGRYGRETVIVPFTMPGERVRVALGARRPEGSVSALLEVLRASPHRVEPRCVHFGPSGALRAAAGLCGGCSWQHIAYPEQLRLKTELVTRLVREQVPQAPAARAMLPGTPGSDPWAYRQKVHFVFGAGVMGHYMRGSRRVIPVRECPVHDERGNRLAFRLRDAVGRTASVRRAATSGELRRGHATALRSSRAHGGGGSDRSRRPGRSGAALLRSVAIRVACNSPEAGATLVLAGDADRGLRSATRRLLESEGAPTSFHVNIHPRDDAFVFGRETRRIAGPDRIREQVAGTTFLISPTAFFQTNVRAAEILVRLVLEAVPAGAAVLDLYAGAGLFALPLARAGHAVVAVEENRAAVADGEASARLNGIPSGRCRFISRKVETVVGGRSPASSSVVVLDPPREGCTREVLDAVFGRIHPALAIYVSCNPEALAHDLRVITTHGYRVESMQPVDMFPHTAHVETVVIASAL